MKTYIKRSLTENEEEKKTLLRSFASNLEKLDARFGKVIVLFERIAIDQANYALLRLPKCILHMALPPVFFLHLLFKCPLFIFQATISI